MRALLSDRIFCVDGAQFRWEDAVLFAQRSGTWAAWERASRQGLACLRHLAAGQVTLEEKIVLDTAAEFRYARGLVSGNDAETWLQARGVSAQEWMQYLRRGLLRERLALQLSELSDRYPCAPDELAEAVRVDTLCSGEGYRVAWDLAARAAAASAVGESLDFASAGERIQAVGRGLERFRRRVTTPAAVGEEIARRHLDWIRIDCRVAGFGDAGSAREALLCLRDGLSLDEVGQQAQTPVSDARLYVEELEPEYQARFLAARALELIGPLELDGRHVLFRVLDKVMPSADDPRLREMAEARVLERALETEARARVQWQVSW